MLSPYRVLDLTDENGLLCSQILADLGADVIRIEPPDGSSARRMAPFVQETETQIESSTEIESSLFWAAHARGSRSIVLDLEVEADLIEFRRLLAGADFFIESAPPGKLASMGLSHTSLLKIQPALVHVSITPFGSDGPKAQWQATDLTQVAAGGFLYLSGEQDRAPLRIRVPQAHAQAGADAAVGALIAHAERRRTGLGQHVDVSQQESMTLATMFRELDAAIEMAPAERVAGGMQAGGVTIPIQHQLVDGWVTLGPSLLPSTGHFMARLLQLVARSGGCSHELCERDWGNFVLSLIDGKLPADAYDEVAKILDTFFAGMTKEQVMRAAVDHKLLLAPTLGIGEIVEGEQLSARHYITRVMDADKKDDVGQRHPGPFAKFSASPIHYGSCAPKLNQHGTRLRDEPTRKPAPSGNEPKGDLPLAGVKILDLFWVLAGPIATRMLADYGATVVRIESPRHPDTVRVSPPWQFSQPHLEGAAGFQAANANKLGLSLDLATAAGREVYRDLIRWCDVATESFAPGVMAKRGLDYKTLCAINPQLIMLSSSIMGQDGPWRDFSGFGRLAVSAAGFQELASWPQRPPSGPFGAYTDCVSARYNAAAILAALEYRERTGRGQYIDLSQLEASLHFLAPAILDWTVNGVSQGPAGNKDEINFPHGVFSTQGDDEWVAISVRDERDWRALCEVLADPNLLTLREDRDRVESALASWCASRRGEEVEALLQAHGIPAHRALDMPSLYRDKQLAHRGHFFEVGHSIYPSMTLPSSRLRFSRTPARTPDSALTQGRDNDYILRELLGYDAERIAVLQENGALGC